MKKHLLYWKVQVENVIVEMEEEFDTREEADEYKKKAPKEYYDFKLINNRI